MRRTRRTLFHCGNEDVFLEPFDFKRIPLEPLERCQWRRLCPSVPDNTLIHKWEPEFIAMSDAI